VSLDGGAARGARSFTPLLPGRWELGEAPRWHPATRELSWVDILNGRAFVATLSDGVLINERSFEFPVAVGAVVRVPDGWQAAAGTGFWAASDDFCFSEIRRVDGLGDSHRANDAALDPHGRFVAGFMKSNADEGEGILGRLSSVDGGFDFTVLLTGCTIPNGIAWSPDGNEMFHADSGKGVITRYRYGKELTSPVVIVDFGSETGMADGLAVDSDGNLWVAMWGGSELRRYSPTGGLLERIPVPVTNPTSLCFAGPDLEFVVVSSARYGLEDPHVIDGALLVGSVGVAGATEADPLLAPGVIS